jgi:hypothetical protein
MRFDTGADMSGGEKPGARREVIVGKNSAIWRVLRNEPRIAEAFPVTLGHAELDQARFSPYDRVWVLAYSRSPGENVEMLARLKAAGARDVVYFSTATTNVASLTRCYNYPTVKLEAERAAREMLNARILTLGVLYQTPADLPAGRTMATSFVQLADFLLDPRWPEDPNERVLLFEPVDRPFSGPLERAAFSVYGALIWSLRRWPCVLRPIDSLIRALRWRWYGYVYLSNRLWHLTTS